MSSFLIVSDEKTKKIQKIEKSRKKSLTEEERDDILNGHSRKKGM